MRILDIVKTLGTTALSVALPGVAPLLIGTVNALLPPDKQLPDTATGVDVERAVGTLSGAEKATLLGREFDVAELRIKEDGSALRAMLAADAANPHSTRPRIALVACYTVCGISTVFALLLAVVAITGTPEELGLLLDGWPFMAALLLPMVGWLDRYFSILRNEQRDRLDATADAPPARGLGGLLGRFVK